jgi:hypothetical protein
MTTVSRPNVWLSGVQGTPATRYATHQQSELCPLLPLIFKLGTEEPMPLLPIWIRPRGQHVSD